MAIYNLGTAQGKIEIDTNDLKNADIALRGAGRAMLGFGATALAAFGYVVGVGAQFEKEMDFVQAVTNASEADMKKLSEAAIELGKKGPFGPREVAGGFVDLAKAGLSAEEIIGGVGEAAVNLAAAGDIPFTQSAEVLVNVLRSFNLEASDATHVIDSIAGAANASTIDISDMATSLKYAAAPAAALGVSVEDVNAALAILGNRGIKGSTAGTALRRVFLNLAAPTKAVNEQLMDLGIVAKDGTNALFTAEGKLKTMPEVFQILGDSMKGFTQQQKVAALNTIFGARAVNSALILMEGGAEQFNAINEQIGQTTAGDVAAKRMDNLAGAIQRFKAAMEATFIQAGSPFQDFLKNIVEMARDVVLWFGKLPKGLQTFILAGVGAVGLLSVLAGGFLLTVGNIVRAIRVLGELGKAFSVIKGAIGAVTGAIRALGVAAATNPFILIIAAVIALGVALFVLYKKSEGFRKFVDGLWQSIQKAWDGIINGFKGVWKAISGFFEGFSKAWSAFKNAFSGGGVTKGLGNIVGWVQRLGNALGIAARAVGNFVLGVINWFRSLPNKIRNLINRVVSVIATFFVNLPKMIGNAFQRAGVAIINFFKELPRRAGFAIGFVIGRFVRLSIEVPKKIIQMGIRAITEFLKFGAKLVQTVIDIFTTVVETVFEFLMRLPGILIDVLTTLITTLFNWGVQLVQLIWTIFTSFIQTIFDFLVGLPGMVWDFLVATVQTLIDIIPKVASAAFDIGTSILDGILDIITGLPGLVWDILWDVIGAFKDLILGAFNAAKDFASSLWEGFKEGLGINSPSFIEEAMFAIQDATAAGTVDLRRSVKTMQGLASGIPPLNSGALGLNSPAQAAVASNGGGQIYNQNAPLIGQASIRSDEDIVALARQLDSLKNDQMAARGRKAVNR